MDLFLSLKLIRKGLIFLYCLPLVIYVFQNYLQFLEESRGKIVIMDVLGEALAPNLNLFDYHIGFDTPDDDGHALCMSYLFDLRMKLKDLHTVESGQPFHTERRLQLYLFPRPGASVPHPVVFRAFRLQEGGCNRRKHLNNTPCLIPREAEDWLAGKRFIEKTYKFSIACENSWYRRYTTEKIITSFLACTVPVYWGNPLVEEEYNPKTLFVYLLFVLKELWRSKELMKMKHYGKP